MNINNEKQKFSYAQLIQQLKNFCIEKRSGTMLIISDDNHSIRFVLNSGVIIACAFTMTQGTDALPLIRNIHAGSYSFVDGGFTGGMNINESPLPDTPIIFNILAGKNTTAKSSPQTTATPITQAVKQDLTKIINEIENELSDYVGPLGEFICEEYFDDFGTPTNQADLVKMIDFIAHEIDTPEESEAFKQRAMSKIA